MKDLEKLNEYLDGELESWASEFLRARISYLRSKQIGNTGKLIRSMEYELNRQAVKEVREILIEFESYGRMIEMKRINHDKWGRNAMDRLMNWVERRGVENFQKGFMRRRKYLPRSRSKLIQSIAWGIMVKRSNGKFRRKRWYNRSKSAAITNLFNQVAAKIPDIVADSITKQFPKQI